MNSQKRVIRIPSQAEKKNEWSYPDYILSHFKYNIFYSEEKEIKIKSLKITQLWRYSAPLNLFWEVFMNDKQ